MQFRSCKRQQSPVRCIHQRTDAPVGCAHKRLWGPKRGCLHSWHRSHNSRLIAAQPKWVFEVDGVLPQNHLLGEKEICIWGCWVCLLLRLKRIIYWGKAESNKESKPSVPPKVFAFFNILSRLNMKLIYSIWWSAFFFSPPYITFRSDGITVCEDELPTWPVCISSGHRKLRSLEFHLKFHFKNHTERSPTMEIATVVFLGTLSCPLENREIVELTANNPLLLKLCLYRYCTEGNSWCCIVGGWWRIL